MTAPTSAGVPLPDGRSSGLQPELLLRQARQLAERATDTPSPRSVHSRRAISTAYYALFHRVCIGVAWTAFPHSPDRARWSLCRTFGHGQIEMVANWVQGPEKRLPRSVAGLVAAAAAEPALKTLASRFVLLKQRRHDADYNHLVTFDRVSARQAVQESRAAVDAVDALDGQPAWGAFSSLVLLGSAVADRG